MNALASVRLHYAVRVGEGRDSFRAEFLAGQGYEIMDEGRGWISIRERATGATRRVPYAGVKDVEPFAMPAPTETMDSTGRVLDVEPFAIPAPEVKPEPPPTRRRRKEG